MKFTYVTQKFPQLQYDIYYSTVTIVYVIVVTWARGICLICMPSALAGPWASGMHVRQITSAHVTGNMYHFRALLVHGREWHKL